MNAWNKVFSRVAITIVFCLTYIILFSAMYYMAFINIAIFFMLGLPIIMLSMYHYSEWIYLDKYNKLR